MAWTLFIFGCVVTLNGAAAGTKGFAGALVQLMHIIIGVCIMVGSMYLRTLGW